MKRRGCHPIAILAAAVREFVRTGQRPPFPPVINSEGRPIAKYSTLHYAVHP
ncbi:MAG: hypothetical protein ACE15F_00995 [bacterium]